MNPRNIVIGGAVLILGVVILSNLVAPERERPARKPKFVATDTPKPVAATHRSVTSRRDYTVDAPPRRETSSTIPTDEIMHSANVTGYMVDNFRSWAALPAGYTADKVEFSNGAVRVAPASRASEPRTGVLESPPLPLRRPTLGAPAQNLNDLPPGASIYLQIAMSRDGERWTPWNVIERHAKPDGNLATPQGQPSLLPGALPPDMPEARQADNVTSGPFIRYRLTLSASGPDSPAVKDVRIWRSVSPVAGR